MKRIVSLLLAFVLLFTLTGCDILWDVVDILLDTTIVVEETAETTDPEWTTVPEETQPQQTQPEETQPTVTQPRETQPKETEPALDKNGVYTKKDDVALYIHLYGELPRNFITKSQARALGWTGGSLEPYAPGKCIGGDRFGNYEGLLPSKKGRTWTECDINTLGKSSRGAKRIVFSNDGLIYYTDDHYESFELLYGEP